MILVYKSFCIAYKNNLLTISHKNPFLPLTAFAEKKSRMKKDEILAFSFHSKNFESAILEEGFLSYNSISIHA
jgi:hypothetical protein